MSTDVDDLLITLNDCTKRFCALTYSDPTQYRRRGITDITKRQLVIYTALLSLLSSGAASTASSLNEPGRSILERLPPKVLGRVLKYLPLRWRIIASQTCSAIRGVALATPDLWTSVKIGPSVQGTYAKDALAEERAKDWTNFTAALSVIARGASGGRPTRAFVSLAASCLHDISSIAFLHHLFRLVTILRLEPYSQGIAPIVTWQGLIPVTVRTEDCVSTVLPYEWRTVADALCAPAPFLEILEISAPRSQWEPLARDISHRSERCIPEDILAGVAGQLRVCYLDGFLIGRAPAFSRLTSFDYRPSPSTILWTDIARIMDQMPVLETLGLCGRFPSPRDGRELASLSPQPPSLRHQSLSRVALVTPSYCMDVMSHQGIDDNVPCLVSLFKDACSRSDLRIIADFRSDRNAHVGTGHFPSHVDTTIVHPRRILANHNVSILQDDIVTVLANPVPILNGFFKTPAGATIDLSSLVDLTISDMNWPEFARLSLTAPQLKAICISILLCSTGDIDVRDVDSIFTEAPAYPSLDFPALETFTISCTSRSDDWGPGICYVELMARIHQGPSSPFRCACRNGGVLSLTEVHALISNTIRLSAPLRELKLMGVRATFDADPVAAFLLAASIAEEVIVDKDVAQNVQYAEALWKQLYARGARFLAPSHSFHPLRAGTFSPDDDFFDHIGPKPPSF